MTEQPDHHTDHSEYDIIAFVKAGFGEPEVALGKPGQCRYCGTTDAAVFRNVAHAIPEALGNRWVTSLDECDACNTAFAQFDDALAKSIGAVLTIGGTRGKGNKVRQTGRSNSTASIRHATTEGRRNLSMRTNGTAFGEHIGFDRTTDELVLRIPAGTERFVPMHAYKGLVKMGIAMLPNDQLADFKRLTQWLLDNDGETLPHMIVGLSFASLGNAPQLSSAALLRRKSANPAIPHMLYMLTVGSLCFQIILKSDEKDGIWPSNLRTRPNITWTNMLAPPGQTPIALRYGETVHLDWAGRDRVLPAIESIDTRIKRTTNEVRMAANLRQSAIAAVLR